MNIVAENKKALFDYTIIERFEAGISLTGDEVKALRAKQCSLKGAFAQFYQGNLILLNANISTYKHAYHKSEEGNTRNRQLLMHKRELLKLFGTISKKGLTLLPLKIYFNEKNIAKVELALATHKKKSDKRQVLRERDVKRETAREIKDISR